jgi:hypothetical protein
MDTPPQKPGSVNSQWSEKPPYLSCLGCLGIALAGLLLVCAGLCGGGYYTLFHTSVPLATLEDMLESGGAMEIEGLSGSISRGFHIDKVRLLADEAHNSELTQIDFEFNGVRDLAKNDRLLIEKFTVGGGMIYYEPDVEAETSAASAEDETADSEPDSENEPSAEESVPEVEITPTQSAFQELRIDLAEVKNLVFVNVQTGDESQVQRVAFKNFQMLRDKVAKVGEFEVEGVNLDEERLKVANLAGSSETGFHLDRLRVQDRAGNWSSLENVRFEFRGLSDLLQHRKLLISNATVAGGEFSAPWQTQPLPTVEAPSPAAEPSGDPAEAPAAEPPESVSTPAISSLLHVEELLVDNLRLANFKLAVPREQTGFQLEEASIGQFGFSQGRITSLRDVQVTRGKLNAADLAAYVLYGKAYDSLAEEEQAAVDQTSSLAERPALPEAEPNTAPNP